MDQPSKGHNGSLDETIFRGTRMSRRKLITIGGISVVVVASAATGMVFLTRPSEMDDTKSKTPAVVTPPVPTEPIKLVVGIQDAIRTTSIIQASAYTGTNLALMPVHDSLFYYGPLENGVKKVFPCLAQSIELVGGDLSRLRVKIRPNITFHDGTKFTAEALKHTIALSTSRPSRRFEYRGIEEVQVEDEMTALFVMKNKSLSNLADVEARSDYRFAVFSPSQDHEGLAAKAVGTGPFKVKEFNPTVNLILERNNDWWGDALPDSEKSPYFRRGNVDEITWVTIREASAGLTALESGDIDILASLSFDFVERVKNNAKITLVSNGAESVLFLYLNTIAEPINDLRVRKAMAHAINREGIHALYGSVLPLASGVLGPGMVGYDPNAKWPYDFDLSKAKEFLAEAGLKDGFDTNIHASATATDPKRVEFAEAMSGGLRAVGINAKVKVVERSVLRQLTFTKTGTEAHMWPFITALGAESLNTFIPYFGPSFIRPWPAKDTPELLELLDTVKTEMDPAKRAVMYRQANKLVNDNVLHLYMLYFTRFRGARSGINLNQWETNQFFDPHLIEVA